MPPNESPPQYAPGRLIAIIVWAGKELLGEAFALRRSNVRQYVMEVCRRFPPVTVLPYCERSAGNAAEQERMINLCMASRDPRVWGERADGFDLRSEEEYERLSVGWAEPALAPTLDAPNAHACPAKALSLAMMGEMLGAWLRTTMGEEAYESDAAFDPSLWESSVGSSLAVYDGGYGVAQFKLRRRAAPQA